jgi:hypothetical protein
MDPIAQFLGSLGLYAAPVQNLIRSGNCGCTALGESAETQDAAKALSTIVSRYAELSAQGERLRQILVAGGQVPCEIWGAYNSACLNYLQKSQPVFDQLAQKGITVEQVVYSGGQPVVDPANPGMVKSLRVSAPLRPPAFSFTAASCPGIANFQGAEVSGGGWVPIPIEMGSITTQAASTAGGMFLILLSSMGAPLGMAGYGTYKTLQQVAVWLEAYFDAPTRLVAAYTDCFERLIKGGLTPAKASSQCAASQASAEQYAKDKAKAKEWGFWTWAAIGGVVLVTGGALALYLRGRVAGVLAPVRMLSGSAYRRKYRRGHRPMLLGKVHCYRE